ncbi:MAG TPA: tRNA (adenosine(37)-N6)-dimethylallyltransferase MiaA [Prolixibacteraceae bacterium]|nr:tRNA (adenosine(37)-N6)-dimethylallyltransferase MiaA [Prolixibacteraceae bacterium]
MPKTLLILLGPTGVGKTDLSIEIAKYYNTEIISCDSRQIYAEMRIGTAVPDQQTLETVPHHFIRSHSIHDYYNASKFEVEVLERLELLFQSKDVVLMTGGSMMYIDALCKGIDDLPEVDDELRKSLMERMETEGIESLRNELRYHDPVYYNEVDLRNPKRILHALEICLMTGKPYSSYRINLPKKRPFNILKLGLNRDREILYSRINQRVDAMFDEGLEKEALSLIPFRHLNSLNTVGYRELFDYFDGKLTIEEAKEKIKANSRKYARKQLTWFRRDSEIIWFTPDKKNEIIAFADQQLKAENQV